jgi:cell division transport system permease protein
MQLVGAKSSFIIKPFLQRAGLQGLISGILASALLYGLLLYINRIIEGIEQLQTKEELAFTFGLIVILGLVIAILSTYKAVKKYLKMSLDELY